jgi:hypothetical protein
MCSARKQKFVWSLKTEGNEWDFYTTQAPTRRRRSIVQAQSTTKISHVSFTKSSLGGAFLAQRVRQETLRRRRIGSRSAGCKSIDRRFPSAAGGTPSGHEPFFSFFFNKIARANGNFTMGWRRFLRAVFLSYLRILLALFAG